MLNLFAKTLRICGRIKYFSSGMKKAVKTVSLREPAESSGSTTKRKASSSVHVKFEVLPTPIKSESDKKDYKVIRLPNGLTACLISDKSPVDESALYDDDDDYDDESSSESENEVENEMEEEMDDRPMKKVPAVEQKLSAAALCVKVGSFSDPKEIPGLAHFLEHMVFMGSAKFPEENDFDAFIKKRGGSDNASTDCETTTFYFECVEKDLFKALDKFSQFFVSPLMKRGSMTREREAIESEFQMALPSDIYRKEQLLCSFAKEQSPVNSFSWGNLKTLRDGVSDDKLYQQLHEFRKTYYSANKMTVAVQARLPMEVLQSYVLECFANVPKVEDELSSSSTVMNIEYFPFDTPEFYKIYYIKPIKDLCQVDLTWCLPPLLDKYKAKPHQYVSYLLGDEGKGSLLSYLRKKVWALSIFTGNGESGIEYNSMYSLFSVSLVLTQEGLENLNNVIGAVFSYIKLLKRVGPREDIFQEVQRIEETSFRFATEETAVDLVEQLAENMHFYPPSDYLIGSELYLEYDPEAIKMVLNYLTPEKMNVMVATNSLPDGLQFNKTEKWFGSQYAEVDITEEVLRQWMSAQPLHEMNLPPPNKFLTTDFAILPEISTIPEYPKKTISSHLVEMWYRPDQKFKLPMAYYYFYLISPASVESASSVCKLEMLINLLTIQLTEDAYPAQVADLSYAISLNDRGIVLKVYGYNEKLPILIDLICRHLKSLGSQLTLSMFDAVKDKLTKSFYNRMLKPSTLSKDLRMLIILQQYFIPSEKYVAMSDISFEEMKRFCEEFHHRLYVKALVQGNVTQEVATKVVSNFVSHLNYAPLEMRLYPKFRVVQIPIGEHFCKVQSFNKGDANSIITNYYQAGPFDLKTSIIIELIMMIIEEPLFDILRTKEQLGYHVFSTIRDTFGILGYTITVNAQATKNTTQYVNGRIEEFIKSANKLLKKMTDKKLNQTKRDLIKMKQCVDVVLKEEVDRNWSEIISDDYMFDRLKQEIRIIEDVKIAELRNFWEEHNAFGSKNKFKKLSIQVAGHNIDENSKLNATQDVIIQKPLLKFLIDETKNGRKYITDVQLFKEGQNIYPDVTETPMLV